MHRAHFPYRAQPVALHCPTLPRAFHRRCARPLVRLLPWICGITVALCLRYGCYGDSRVAVGPKTSHLMKASSVFVKQVRVKGDVKQNVRLYGFKDRPELGLETNWTVSKQLHIAGYGREGFFMWLNKGSRICMHWNIVHGGRRTYDDMLVLLIKRDRKLEESQTFIYMNVNFSAADSADGGKTAEYVVPDDDSYDFRVLSLTPWSIAMALNVNMTLKIYDLSKATSICSMSNGPCKLDLRFPWPWYYVLTASESNVDMKFWHVEISFLPRLIVYFPITGVLVAIVYCFLKKLGACDSDHDTTQDQDATQTETDPILPRKEIVCVYGATEEQPESSFCSSEDLYSEKICTICYDEHRSCFFIPCGHSATCFTCAERIMEDESKVCPICRRLIHKVRRLRSP